MKKLYIKNLQGLITHANKKATEEELIEWFEKEKSQGSFGKSERWLTKEEASLEGQDLANSIETKEEDTHYGTITIYKFPQEYTYEISDITNLEKIEKDLIRRIQKQNHGNEVIALITEINKTKGYNLEQFSKLMMDPQLLVIERLGRSGSLELLKGQIAAYTGSWYTKEDTAKIIEKIDQFYIQNPGN